MNMLQLLKYLEDRKAMLENTRKNSNPMDEGLLPRIDEIERTLILLRGETKTKTNS